MQSVVTHPPVDEAFHPKTTNVNLMMEKKRRECPYTTHVIAVAASMTSPVKTVIQVINTSN